MIREKLETLVHLKHKSLLGVGPMSVNCVDAAIELANEFDSPLMMIASRRQIDSEDFGGGYVNQWSTDRYASYVMDNDKKGRVILARDHGGPWQNEFEKNQNMSLEDAMQSAKDSYQMDIDSGFGILHIDPSVDIHSHPDIDQVLERIYELYDFCWSYAKEKGKNIAFEIGTEEQSGTNNTQEELEYTLANMKKFCRQNSIDFPSFVVIQAGTRVMETRNIGSFNSPIRVANELPPEIQIPRMIDTCNKYGVFMKEHNTDYLPTDALRWQPRLGIHAANVAPEFGVSETKAFIRILQNNGHIDLLDSFLEISYNSKKWEKWMLEGTDASDLDRAIIAGHYTFSSHEFIELKKRACDRIVDLDSFLKNQVKKSISRYLYAFNLT